MGGFTNGLTVVIGLGAVVWVFKEMSDGRLGRAAWTIVIAAVLAGYIQSESLRNSINTSAATVAQKLVDEFDDKDEDENQDDG